MKYLYRLCGGWHDEIEANLHRLGVAYDWAATVDHWKWYRISVEEASKLPKDGDPYLPISDDIGGYGLYHDPNAEKDVAKKGLSWRRG